jgi:hypothetical protein
MAGDRLGDRARQGQQLGADIAVQVGRLDVLGQLRAAGTPGCLARRRLPGFAAVAPPLPEPLIRSPAAVSGAFLVAVTRLAVRLPFATATNLFAGALLPGTRFAPGAPGLRAPTLIAGGSCLTSGRAPLLTERPPLAAGWSALIPGRPALSLCRALATVRAILRVGPLATPVVSPSRPVIGPARTVRRWTSRLLAPPIPAPARAVAPVNTAVTTLAVPTEVTPGAPAALATVAASFLPPVPPFAATSVSAATTLAATTAATATTLVAAPLRTGAFVPAPLITGAFVPAPLITGAFVPAPLITGAFVPAPLITGALVPAPLIAAPAATSPIRVPAAFGVAAPIAVPATRTIAVLAWPTFASVTVLAGLAPSCVLSVPTLAVTTAARAAVPPAVLGSIPPLAAAPAAVSAAAITLLTVGAGVAGTRPGGTPETLRRVTAPIRRPRAVAGLGPASARPLVLR